MPKLNAVAMVVLTLAVLGVTGAVVLRKPGRAPEGEAAGRLLRNLADRDPDVSQEAATALQGMGVAAVPALQAASSSPDRLLAERARRILAQRQPPPPSSTSTVESEVTPKAEMLEFVLESRGGPAKPADLGALWVQLRNAGSAPVLVARSAERDHPPMAVFEVEDPEGHTRTVAADVVALTESESQDIVPVRPREAVILFQGGAGLAEAVSKPGIYRIRFLYDATEGSDYRRRVRPSTEGILLPPVRLTSNPVSVQVSD